MKPDTLELISKETPLPSKRADIPAIWTDFREQIEKLKATAETLSVTDIKDTAGMKLARVTRLSLREIRCAVENKRKELVTDRKKELAAIDADAKAIKDYCEAQESRLELQEKFAELENARVMNENKLARELEIAPFLLAPLSVNLGNMSEADYLAIFNATKDAYEAKQARESKEKADAEAAAKAERERIEAQRLENERLKKEAAEREAAALKEREAAKQREQEATAKAKAERDEIEDKAAKERAAAAEIARKEREAAEAIARQEREAREKIEREIAAKKAADDKVAREKAAAEKKAAAAPDAAKLVALAKSIRAIALPTFANGELDETVRALVEKYASNIEHLHETL